MNHSKRILFQVSLALAIVLLGNLSVVGNNIKSDIKSIIKILNELPEAEDERYYHKYSIKTKNGGNHLTVITDTYDRLKFKNQSIIHVFFLEDLDPNFVQIDIIDNYFYLLLIVKDNDDKIANPMKFGRRSASFYNDRVTFGLWDTAFLEKGWQLQKLFESAILKANKKNPHQKYNTDPFNFGCQKTIIGPGFFMTTKKQYISRDSIFLNNIFWEVVDTPPLLRSAKTPEESSDEIERFVKSQIALSGIKKNRTLHVNIYIDKQGKLIDANLVFYDKDPSLNEKALQIATGLNEWTPAVHHGRNVCFKKEITITFLE